MAVEKAADAAATITLRLGERFGLLQAIRSGTGPQARPDSTRYCTVHLALTAAQGVSSDAAAVDVGEDPDSPQLALLRDAFALLGKDSPATVLVTILFALDGGYVVRSDFLERRLEGCELARRAKSFLTPLAHVAGLPANTDPGRLAGAGLLGLLPSAAGGMLSLASGTTPSVQDAHLGALDEELALRLGFAWLSPRAIRRRRVVWVQGREDWASIHRAYDAAWALGIDVVVVDEPGHWLEDEAGPHAGLREAFVPCSIAVDGGLAQRLCDVVRAYPRAVDGLVTVSDARLASVAKACEELGLPTSPAAAYELAGDKGASRLLEAKAVGDFVAVVSGVDELDEVVGSHEGAIPFPLIVKPCLGWNSDCVSKVGTLAELRHAVRRASERHANAPTKVTRTVIEPYISGPEVDANFVMLDGELLYHQMLDDFPCTGDTAAAAQTETEAAAPNFMETLMLLPSGLPADEQAVLRESLQQSILRQGFTSGVFHCEARVRGSRAEYRPRADNGLLDLHVDDAPSDRAPTCYLHEINARTPGYSSSVCALLTHGVDYYALRLLFALGDAQERIRALSVPFGHPQSSQWTLGLAVFPPSRGGGVMASEDAIGEMLEADQGMRAWVAEYQTMVKAGARVYGPGEEQLWYIGYASIFSREGRRECLERVQAARERFTYKLQGE